MKKFLTVSIIMITIIQSILLALFFAGNLSNYPINTVDIVWISFNFMGILVGILYFKMNKDIIIPTMTIPIVALFGIILFLFMLFKYWIIVPVLIIIAIRLHTYVYRYSKFTIVPVITSIMGIYSLILLLLMTGITSM